MSDERTIPPEQTESAAPQGGEAVLAAIRRLSDALAALEAGIEDRLTKKFTTEEAEAEIQRLADDRTRLAQTLDAAEARAVRLAGANGEVSRRLVSAMETIRSVLDRQDPDQERSA